MLDWDWCIKSKRSLQLDPSSKTVDRCNQIWLLLPKKHASEFMTTNSLTTKSLILLIVVSILRYLSFLYFEWLHLLLKTSIPAAALLLSQDSEGTPENSTVYDSPPTVSMADRRAHHSFLYMIVTLCCVQRNWQLQVSQSNQQMAARSEHQNPILQQQKWWVPSSSTPSPQTKLPHITLLHQSSDSPYWTIQFDIDWQGMSGSNNPSYPFVLLETKYFWSRTVCKVSLRDGFCSITLLSHMLHLSEIDIPHLISP